MSLKAIWETHRAFLIRVAGGLAVFLICVTWIQGYRGDATAQVARNASAAAAVEKLQGALDLTYDRELREGRVLEKRLDHLLGQVSISRQARVKMPSQADADFEIDFAKQKGKVWREFQSRANRVNLDFPTQKDVGFSITTDLERSDWQDRYLQLDIIKRVLNAVVDVGGVTRIEAIDPGAVTTEPISGSDSEVILRYPVRVELHLDFASSLGLMERFQGAGNYLSVEIEEMTRDPDDPEGILRATIDFIGVDIGAPRERRSRSPFRRRKR